jgi:hypothetical protein
MKSILPMPLCEKHFELISSTLIECPECRERVSGILELPFVERFIPPKVKEVIASLMLQADKKAKEERAEHIEENR